MSAKISRRSFVKLALVSAGGLVGSPLLQSARKAQAALTEFPQADLLARVCVGKIDLKARPDEESDTVGVLYEDAVLPWLREVAGRKPWYINQRWVETPEGFIYSPYLQPVRNLQNQPVDKFEQTTQRGEGMWVEVTVPYVNVRMVNAEPTENSWVAAKIADGQPLRLYYQQVFWVDRIRTTSDGTVQYRINPNYFGGLDMLWADAAALRPITREEIAPISPEIENKRVLVNILRQELSAFENDVEVFYCRCSTGAKFDMYGNVVDNWATPVGTHKVTRKYISLQMSGGTTGASYDLPGIGWSSIFATGGVAIHSTYWHNDYGVPRSHGCVNVRPDDSKWLFRWLAPHVTYDSGREDTTVTGDPSTAVRVIDW